MRSLSLALRTAFVFSVALAATTAGAHGAPGAATPAPQEIRIENFSFAADTITVPVGTTITWINRDDAPHKVVSNDRKAFSSPVLDTGEKFAFTFTKPGVYPYFCSIHPMMTGKVIVTGEGK